LSGFDYSLVSRIQQANDIVEVIGEHLRLDKKGKELVGLCPFHADHRPSLYVNPAKQIFKCFACGAGGDVLKFIQMRENLTFPQALERLAQRAGILLDHTWSKKQAGSRFDEPDSKTLSKINAWAMQIWIGNLKDPQKGAQARQYLESRQISDQSVRDWKLGFASDGWDDLVSRSSSAKLTAKMLTASGLAVPKEPSGYYDKFRNRLMFPIHDVGGRVIGFGGRTLGGDPAKYMNSPATALFDKSRCLYGLEQARHAIVESGTAVVVEGYTDVIMAHQFGVRNVVASLGTSFTTGHAHLLRRFARRIILLFDSDRSGQAAAERALEVCLAEKIDIRMAFIPGEKDPCDFLLQMGAEPFRKVLEEARDVMEYTWNRLVDQMEQGDTMADRTEAMTQFLKNVASGLLSGKVDSLSRTLLLTRLSSLLGLSAGRVEAELKKFMKKTNSSAFPEETKGTGGHYIIEAQREILEVLLNEPGLLAEQNGKIRIELFTDPIFREIARILLDFLEEGIEPTLAQLCARTESPQTAGWIVDLQQSGAQRGNYRDRLRQAAEVLWADVRSRKKEAAKARLKEKDGESLRTISEILRSQKGDRRSGVYKP